MAAPIINRKFCMIWDSDIPRDSLYEDQSTPYPRSGHRIVVTDGDLYSIGGYNPDFWDRENQSEETNYPLFKELWKFNLLKRKWTKMKTCGVMPKELASHSALLHKNNILIFGGTGIPFGEAASNKVHILNLKTLYWKELPTTGEPPLPGYGTGIAIVGQSLYVFAGTTGWTYNADVFKLDLDTLEWEKQITRGKPPEGRYRHECACDDKTMYVFGGGRAMEVFSLEQLPAFEFETCNWDTIPCRPDPGHGYPAPRRCHSCVQLQNDVYICGGYNGDQIYGDLWRINLKTLVWLKLETKLLLPSYFHSAAVTTGGWMFVYGGVTTLDIERTSAVRGVLLGLPTLRELSWLQVVAKIPHLDPVPMEHLLELGVPKDLLDRLL